MKLIDNYYKRQLAKNMINALLANYKGKNIS